MDLSYFRRTSRRGNAPVEDASELPESMDPEVRGREIVGQELIGQELVGQELVPVIPMTPSAMGGVANGTPAEDGALEVYTTQVVAERVEVRRAMEALGDGASLGEQDSHQRPVDDAMTKARPTTSSAALSPELPVRDDHGQLQGHAIWPGGPTSSAPQSYGPMPAGVMEQRRMISASNEGPLFDYDQLRRLQDLQEEAPQLYGRQPMLEVHRPDFLAEEEELQRKLAEIQERKRRAESERKKLEDQRELDRVRQENVRLKEMLSYLMDKEKGTPEKTVVSQMEYATPEQDGDDGLQDGLLRGEDGLRRGEYGLFDGLSRGERRDKDEGGVGSRHLPGDGKGSDKETMRFMMTMLEGMQKLLIEKEEEKGKGSGGVEVVKSSTELPRLPDWSQETGPIDLGDWIATIEPFMEDLSDGASEWWHLLWEESNRWYGEHLALTPLQRLSHEIQPSKELAQSKWVRLERRAAGMLMAALPQAVREEVVSTRSVSALGILTKLLVIYQPGGLAEKSLILSSLEAPREEQNIQGAVQALRKWIRWRRRAADVQVSIPDPTVLMKGLSKLTKKVMASNPELAFRVSLARSTLQVDSIPTHQTVAKIADHILAEMEQVAHQDRKSKENTTGDPAKLKEMKAYDMGGDGKGSGKGKGKEKGQKGDRQEGLAAGGDQKCKFYLTDQGCRKGKDCRWSHDQSDGRKRCYTCGGVDHYAPECPRKSGQSGLSSSPQKQKMSRAEELQKEESSKAPSEGGASYAEGETVQQLLTEANKMLKSLGKDRGPEVTQEDRMKALQQQLDELRMKTKTLRLTRISSGEMAGLIDSGATHPMRGMKKGEEVKSYQKVQVTLASGKTEELRMTPQGVMVVEGVGVNQIEPIVPFGTLVKDLKCRVNWDQGGLEIHHPRHGQLKVEVINGCPQVKKKLALQLIDELEVKAKRSEEVLSTDFSWERRLEERAWLRNLVEMHPAFKDIPEELKEKIVVTPHEDYRSLPANRRARKVWRREGCVLHLFAGEAEGYTFSRAMKETTGTSRQVLEIDVKRGLRHDVTTTECYGSLLRLALEGDVRVVIGGPNCRTRSVLRTYPGGPPPSRSWEDGQEFGNWDLTEEEAEKVHHDDEMMWKMILIYLVAKLSRRAKHGPGVNGHVAFLLEQPAPPDYRPQVVSFWWMPQWKSLMEMENLEMKVIRQGDYGGMAVKPTGIGTDLQLEPGRLCCEAKGRPSDGSGNSKELARWAPGLMRAIAVAVCRELARKITQKALNWDEHLRAGHVPFHRDCRVCQESAAKDRPHRKVKHPKAGVLSLDLAGPLHKYSDHEGPKKYILVGAYTWIAEKGKAKEGFTETVEDDAPEIEDKKDDEEHEVEAEAEKEEEEVVEGERPPEDAVEPEEFEIEVFRLAIPVQDRSAEKVFEAVVQLYLQFRADGFPITQLHTDRAKEFRTKTLQKWCLSRNIYKTTTSGDSPQQNGRAERAVQAVKARIRTQLHERGWGVEKWPLACWNVNSSERLRMKKKEGTVPPFGYPVLVRKRYWKSKELEPTHQKVDYIAYIPESHGHLVRQEDGKLMIASYVLGRTMEPPEKREAWIAIQTELQEKEDEQQVRRRIRGKTSVRKAKMSEEVDPYEDEGWKESAEQGEEEKVMFRQRMRSVIEQESLQMIEEDEEVGKVVYRRLIALMKLQQEDVAEEEVLRTRIVSVNEFLQEAQEWDPAIRTELDQLFEEKKALVKAKLEDLQRMKEQNLAVQLIPSKLVITLKPGPKRKVRVVACGNYVEFRGEELFAAGADSASLRLVLKTSAELSWNVLTVDIRVAFLNAPLTTTMKDGSDETKVTFALKPPHLLVKLGYATTEEVWIAEKAMYGLRQSPRSWSIHRDETLRSLRVPDLQLRQALSEPNLWVVEDEEASMRGIVLVYVDDMLIAGENDVPERILREVQRKWQTSEPERVTAETSTKFLGMEISRQGTAIKASQEAFVMERLMVNLGEEWEKVKDAAVPCGREVTEIYPEENPSAENVREAQRIVGELLWLVTRTRVDLMFVTAKLSQWVLKAPKEVIRLSRQIWAYLKRTRRQGLLFTSDQGSGWAGEERLGLQAYSDASFAPAGQVSVGAVVIQWDGSPMMWRAGKQPFPTLSAAEAELTEATEAMLMGDAFDALLGDLFGGYPRTLMVDNQAAINLISEEGGAWRTRHLRLRANHLRWRFGRLDWRVNHCPGSVMIADIGTKPLLSVRLQDLKALLGMSGEVDEEPLREEGPALHGGAVEKVLKLLVMATMVQMVKSEGSDEEDGEGGNGRDEEETAVLFAVMASYTFVVVLVILVMQRLMTMWNSYINRDDGSRRRLLEAEDELREAERDLKEAEKRSMRAEERVKRLREENEDQDSRRSSRRSSQRSSGRRTRSEYETRSISDEYQPTTPSEQEVGENQGRLGEAGREREESVSTREYQEREDADSRGDRFNVFNSGMREEREDTEEENEGPRERGEETREVILPESQGPGRYVLEARGARRRIDAEVEREGQDEDTSEITENEVTQNEASMNEATQNDFTADSDEIEEGTPQPEEVRRMVEEEREEELHEEDPMVTPGEDTTTEGAEGEGPVHRVDQRDQREAASGSGEPDFEPEAEDQEAHGGDQLRPGLPQGDDHALFGGDLTGQGGQLALVPAFNPPLPPGHEGDEPNYRVWITPMGARYHTSMLCPTLHNTRRIRRSHWCPVCGHRRVDQRYTPVYIESYGGDAHHDQRCPRMGLRMPTQYAFCQRCPRFNPDYAGPYTEPRGG